MCLAVPMKLIEIKDEGDTKRGVVETGGVMREVDLTLLKDVKTGDYVIVHAGFAIEKIDPGYAKEIEDIWRELEPV